MSVAFSIMLVFHALGLPDSSLACRSDFFGVEHCMTMPPKMIKSSFLFIVVIIWCGYDSPIVLIGYPEKVTKNITLRNFRYKDAGLLPQNTRAQRLTKSFSTLVKLCALLSLWQKKTTC